MRVQIDGHMVDATLIRPGALETRGGRNIRPILVAYEGRDVWVYDDEGDARMMPGDTGPVRSTPSMRSHAKGDISWA